MDFESTRTWFDLRVSEIEELQCSQFCFKALAESVTGPYVLCDGGCAGMLLAE